METMVEKKPRTLSHIELSQIRKRDGSLVPFDLARIKNNDMLRQMKLTNPQFIPSVEQIQDLVEKELILDKFAVTAKSYILYREKHAEMRREAGPVSERLRTLAKESKKYFKNPLAEFISYSSYARWVESEGRRETWIETVDRYMNFMKEKLADALTETEYFEVREA